MKIVVGSWLISVPALVGCVDKESQGIGTDTDASGATSGLPGTGSVEPGPTSGADTSVTPPGTGGETQGGGTGDAGTGGEDTGSMPGGTGSGDTTGSVASGCQKIDLLFVIDNSSTMGAEQQSLIAAFPGFYDSVKNTLGVSDYHIMAVAADDGKILGNNSKCKDKACTCGPAPACCDNVCNGGNFAESCNGQACDTLAISECVYTYGAGRDYNTDGTFCNLAEGRRYMLDSQADVPATFACIASAGTYDTIADKKPMLAAQEAVSPTQNGAGACNDGFLRDDALLVLVFVSDKDDANAQQNSGSPGEPADWYSAIVAAKGGDAAKVVVLGLVGDGNMPAGVCAPEDEPDMMAQIGAPAPRLQEFVGMFPHGALGSVCAPDYAPFFTGAISIIEQACEALPPGP
jgi:hypothetical protein